MSKYELTISKNYVPDWGIVEAVRELFQNALDQEVVSSENKMFFAYDEDNQILEIGNKHSVLEPQSLLLGQTTKIDDDLTIGQFGEGYKIAMLILLRNDLKVTFYNYGKKEIWKPRFVKSRRYNQDILTVFTEKVSWRKIPENSLTIKIEGIDEDMYEEIIESNLHLQGIGKHRVSKSYGKLLEDEELKGKIFVNGLYVTEDSSLKYGYDFLPSVLKLKRDRSMVGSFDLKVTTMKLWETLEGSNNEEIAKMIVEEVSDVSHLEYTYTNNSYSKEVFDAFKKEYGEEAIAVKRNEDLGIFMEEHPDCKPIVVENNVYDSLSKDKRHKEELENTKVEVDRTTKEKLEVWFKDLRKNSYISWDKVSEFNKILEEL